MPRSELSTEKFIRDIAFFNVPVPFQKLQTYLWLLVLTRELGAIGFGAWSLFMATLNAATTVSTMNCGSSLMRFLSGERDADEVNQAFSTVLAMVAITGLLVAFLLFGFGRWFAMAIFNSRSDVSLIALLSASIIFHSLFEELKNVLRARRLNKVWACLSLTRLLVETVAVIGAAILLRNPRAACSAYLVSGVLCVSSGLFYLRTRLKVRLVRPAMQVCAKYLRYGLPLLPGVFASTISLGADRYVVGHFLGLRQVGVYGACFTISAVVFFVVAPINDVLFPEMSALYDSNQWPLLNQRFGSAQKFVLGFAVGVATILVAFPRQVLFVVAPLEFASGTATLAILGVQGVFMAFVLLYVTILNMRFRVWSTTCFWMVSAAAIILVDIVLVPRIGIVGAAVSQLAVTAAGAFVLLGMHWQIFLDTFEFGWIRKALLASAVVCILSWVIHANKGTLTAAACDLAAGVISFGICLLLTGYCRIAEIKRFAAVFF